MINARREKAVVCRCRLQVNESLAALVRLQDFFLQSVVPLLVSSPQEAQLKLESWIVEGAPHQSVIADSILEPFKFQDSKFSQELKWDALISAMTQAKTVLETMKQEMSELPNAARKGRPFGSLKKNKEESREDGENTIDNPEQTKKKRRTQNEPDVGTKGPVEPSEEVNVKESGNKTKEIPLYMKYLIVKHTLELQREGAVQNIEKEVMQVFHKYFWNSQSGRFKTGLLSKWMKCLASNSIIFYLNGRFVP